MARKKDVRKFWRLLGGVTVVLALVAVSLMGWQWMASLRIEQIEVVGATYGEEGAIVKVAGIDTSRMLLDIDPVLIADRVRRHPWVREADVTRLPSGVLRIGVGERTPVLLAIDRQGRPAYYLDRDGYAMPRVDSTAFDVPLLRGLEEAYHPVRPTEHPAVLELLGVLPDLDPNTDALLSEFEVQRSGELMVHTTATDAHGSIPVWLGREAFAERLGRLRAFWEQAVLTQPDKSFNLIDLRFDSQVVTRERDGGS